MYADRITKSMEYALKETERRRKIQIEYNDKNNIIPTTIKKDIRDVLEISTVAEEEATYEAVEKEELSVEEIISKIKELEEEMKLAAKDLQFERAAELRDEINLLKEKI